MDIMLFENTLSFAKELDEQDGLKTFQRKILHPHHQWKRINLLYR